MRPELSHIDAWIFDLDNSLFRKLQFVRAHDLKMGDYIQRLLEVDAIEARRVQKDYFHAHGTTLAGLMAEHGTDPHDFLEFVHDIDLARLAADPALVASLDKLPGRKFVFTNASEDLRSACSTGLNRQRVRRSTNHACLCAEADPFGYAAIGARHGIEPKRSASRDMARNLAPARRRMGLRLWVDWLGAGFRLVRSQCRTLSTTGRRIGAG